MYAVPWQLRERTAVLQSGGLLAEIISLRPSDGMVNIVVAGRRLAEARLLGIAVDPDHQRPIAGPSEVHIRGADLVVACEEPGQWPLHVDAVWRAVAATTCGEFLAGVDLIVSVRTHVLDAHPNLTVESIVPASEVLRVTAGQSMRAPIEPLSSLPTIMGPESGGGCLLFRLPNVELTYVEMVHPVDFQYDELSRSESGGDSLRLAHRLFRTDLEKGVLLRARLRGIFVNRHNDAQVAATCCASFATSEPPLST